MAWSVTCSHLKAGQEAGAFVSNVPHLTGKLLLAVYQQVLVLFPKTFFRTSNPRGKGKSCKWLSQPGTRSHVPLLSQFLLENLTRVCSKDEETIQERGYQEAKITRVHLGRLPITASHSLREKIHNTWIWQRTGVWNIQRTDKNNLKRTKDWNIHLTKGNKRMGHNHRRRYSTSLVIKKTKIKTQWLSLTSLQWLKSERTDITKCWKGNRTAGATPIHCWWEWKMVQPLWRRVWQFLIIKYILTMWPSNSTPRHYLARKNKNQCHHKQL